MGIDISGGMIVGEYARKINIPEDYDGDYGDWVGYWISCEGHIYF